MTDAPIPTTLTAGMMEKIIVQGDISRLSTVDRLRYYKARCEAAGLDPRTEPFGYIKDKSSGKVTLYARKAAAEQIANDRCIGIKLEYHKREGGDLPIYMVKVQGMEHDKNGRPLRVSEEIGCVPMFRSVFTPLPPSLINSDGEPVPEARTEGGPEIVQNDVWAYNPEAGKRTPTKTWGFWETRQLVGEDACNAMMKAVTKAKRRLVLSMAGLGVPDESEIGAMPVDVVKAEDMDITGDDENAPWAQDDPDTGRIVAEWSSRITEAEDAPTLQTVIQEMEAASLEPNLAGPLETLAEERLTQLMLAGTA